MACIKTLTENWTLCDAPLPGQGAGVLKPFPLDGPCDVEGALLRQGVLSRRRTGLETLHDEWIFRRAWRYENTFDWTGEDEWCQLLCDAVVGLERVILNEKTVFEAEPRGEGAAPVNIDMTEDVVEGENRLRVFVRSAHPAEALHCGLGVFAPVRLRTGHYMTVDAHEMTLKDDAVASAVRLDVRMAAKYTFKYAALLDDELVCGAEFEEKLFPGKRCVRHVLPLEKTVSYDRARPEQTTIFVRLSIERQGVGCQLFVENIACVAGAPLRRVCRIGRMAWGDRLEGQYALARALGADGLIWPGRDVSPMTGFVQAQSAPEREDEAALLQLEDMQGLAGGEAFWPIDERGVWGLAGNVAPCAQRIEGLFGVNAMGDAARAARLTRFLQAERVRKDALEARLRGEPYVVTHLKEERPALGSTALVEFSGAARPAFDALQEAWKNIAVCALLPEGMAVRPGQAVRIPVWLLSSGAPRDVVKVEAALMGLDGKVIASISLPAVLGEDGCVGELAAALPKAVGAYIVRVEAVRAEGAVAARGDWTLAAGDEEAPLHALLLIGGALLREKNGYLVNEGAIAALGVCSGGYRALLPGEGMPCADTYECLNGLI